MQYIGAHEARSQFGELLNRVALGEKIAITRNGKEVAMIVPPQSGSEEQGPFEIFRAIREKLRAEGKLMTAEEIKASIEEGRP